VLVDAYEAGGSPLLADAVARVTLPGGSQREFALHQTAPGQYTQELVLPTAGAYGIEVLLQRDDQQYYAETGYAHQPSRIYTPLLPYAPMGKEPNTYPQDGQMIMQHLAERTGGRVLDEQTLIEQQEVRERVEQEQPALLALQTMLRHNLWIMLLSLALILWIIEIAFRRRGKV
jgi:hypothetical protein